MTFKLKIGDRLMREERAPASKTASDLVRDFRKRLRDEARTAKVSPRPSAEVLFLYPSRKSR